MLAFLVPEMFGFGVVSLGIVFDGYVWTDGFCGYKFFEYGDDPECNPNGGSPQEALRRIYIGPLKFNGLDTRNRP